MSDVSFPRGSEWRRWDLHVHTKGTNRNDQFNSTTFEEFAEILFKKAIKKEIYAIGITDYFSVDNYKHVKAYADDIDTKDNFTEQEKAFVKGILLIPNVELRMIPVTDSGRLVNIHCIFNPDYVDSLENNFFGSIDYVAASGTKFKMNNQGFIDLGKSLDGSLNDRQALEKGLTTIIIEYSQLQRLLDGNKRLQENVIVAVSNSSQDGASAFQKHYDLFEDGEPGSLEALRKSVYSLSNCIFSSNENDVLYFTGQKSDGPDLVKQKCGSLKACIHGSDAHTEDRLFTPDNNKYCWIKADLTFEGLKQILYEPISGDRVKIGPVMPDQKDNFKVIRRISFNNSSDFPGEVEFNSNLCSIIGSRSSGKSALLAYIAHSIDKECVEKITSGPGEGEDFHWDKINLDYNIVWDNGMTNEESPGNIVYIPQNYLNKESRNPDEIKKRIEPVLFKAIPEFKVKCSKTFNDIDTYNRNIENQIDIWLDCAELLKEANDNIRSAGKKDSIEQEIGIIEENIRKLKEENELSDDELNKYKEISESISSLNSRIEIINTELNQLGEITLENKYFSSLTIDYIPSLAALPENLQVSIQEAVNAASAELLEIINEQISNYKEGIIEEKGQLESKIAEMGEVNETIIAKYKSNIELERLIVKLNTFKETLGVITQNEGKCEDIRQEMQSVENEISDIVERRDELLRTLKDSLESTDQSKFDGLIFGIEYEIGNRILDIECKINTKERSEYLENRKLNIGKIRQNPGAFINAVYRGDQKINTGIEKREVLAEAFTLTEKVLFSATMEGDRIGGFSEPTMTPGKRALFALKLILAESEDSWPLLIDQPEDDLDSRSIYLDVVPFLKEKKKERQILMVSHNANLVIGADTEQIIVANRHGDDRKNSDGKQFNYLTGSMEFTRTKDENEEDTLKSQGIREHACDVLDGGKIAFENRRNKYNI